MKELLFVFLSPPRAKSGLFPYKIGLLQPLLLANLFFDPFHTSFVLLSYVYLTRSTLTRSTYSLTHALTGRPQGRHGCGHQGGAVRPENVLFVRNTGTHMHKYILILILLCVYIYIYIHIHVHLLKPFLFNLLYHYIYLYLYLHLHLHLPSLPPSTMCIKPSFKMVYMCIKPSSYTLKCALNPPTGRGGPVHSPPPAVPLHRGVNPGPRSRLPDFLSAERRAVPDPLLLCCAVLLPVRVAGGLELQPAQRHGCAEYVLCVLYCVLCTVYCVPCVRTMCCTV
jgi:hypothetical protein